jgi:hypothetical protein
MAGPGAVEQSVAPACSKAKGAAAITIRRPGRIDMAFGSETNLAGGAFARRPGTRPTISRGRRKDAAPQVPEGETNAKAQASVALVHDYIERRVHQEGDAQPRGMARQMAMATLLLERLDPAGLDHNLIRVVRVYHAARATTPAALKKHASEARAILRYGVAEEGGPGGLASLSDDGAGEALARIDAMILSIRPKEMLERRAQELSGQRGGRPSNSLFKVLSAVARLKAVASAGDPKAEAELKLVRTFLLDD